MDEVLRYEPLRRPCDDPHAIFEKTRGRWTDLPRRKKKPAVDRELMAMAAVASAPVKAEKVEIPQRPPCPGCKAPLGPYNKCRNTKCTYFGIRVFRRSAYVPVSATPETTRTGTDSHGLTPSAGAVTASGQAPGSEEQPKAGQRLIKVKVLGVKAKCPQCGRFIQTVLRDDALIIIRHRVDVDRRGFGNGAQCDVNCEPVKAGTDLSVSYMLKPSGQLYKETRVYDGKELIFGQSLIRIPSVCA